jgi:hypothetical protein
VEAGVGFGLTPDTDDLAFKLMLISDLTGPHGLLGLPDDAAPAAPSL